MLKTRSKKLNELHSLYHLLSKDLLIKILIEADREIRLLNTKI